MIIVFCGCGHRVNTEDLNNIDSLVSAEKYDSAYYEVQKINPQAVSLDEDKAHYYLLLAQTSCLTKNQMPPDSLIDFSISYYKGIDDKEKLCDAFYYKAYYQINKGDYLEAILLCKKAEKLANQTKNAKQQFKVADCIAHINEMNGNYDLQLQHSKQALNSALKMNKQKWIISTYNKICEAFLFQDKIDSALVYAEKIVPFISNIDITEKPYILNNIGYCYLIKDRKKAKSFFEASLLIRPMARNIENLAWVYLQEDNEQKAYELWKQAMITNDNIPQDNILYHILQYDLEHHNINGACERLGEIVSIKDSLNNVLKDRSIQNLQQEFDEKADQERHEQEVLRWVIFALALAVIILLLLGYFQYRRYKARLLLAEQQMQINDYLNRVNRLREQNAENEREITANEQQITDLSEKINDLIEHESPRLYKGKLLYDQIKQDNSIVTWTKDDLQCFIDFYKANDYASYSRIIRKYGTQTAKSTFFLILYEMGKDDKKVRQIMGITQEAIRSTRHRIKNKK